jgi:hypothetical protein
MKPSVALLGFVLGSAASITFGLIGVVVVFLFLPAETPRVQSELPLLLGSAGGFAVLTLLAALSFYGQLKDARWRRLAIAALFVGLAAMGFAYWPT